MEYVDLRDFYENNQSQFGIQTNFGQSTNKDTSTKHTSGSTTITLVDTGEEREGVTRATIGEGTIIVGGAIQDALEGLNRDVNNNQEVTKDMITGALDGSFTVDNRLLDIIDIKKDEKTGEYSVGFDFQGYKDIYGDFKNFDTNLVQAGKNAAMGAGSIVQFVDNVTGTVADAITGDLGGDKGIFETIGDKFQKQGIVYDIATQIDTSDPDWMNKNAEQIAKICSERGITVEEFYAYTENDVRQAFAVKDGEGGYETIAIGLEDKENPGTIISDENKFYLLGYETTDHATGTAGKDAYADYMGNYTSGAASLYDWFSGGNVLNNNSSMSVGQYNQLYGGAGSNLEQSNVYVREVAPSVSETQNLFQWHYVLNGEMSMEEAQQISDMTLPAYKIIAAAQTAQVSTVAGGTALTKAVDYINGLIKGKNQTTSNSTEQARFSEDPSQTGHVFRNAEGHFSVDTPQNREVIQNTINPDNFRGVDDFGNSWYSKTLEDGTQSWASVRNGTIQNGGLNNKIIDLISKYNLK